MARKKPIEKALDFHENWNKGDPHDPEIVDEIVLRDDDVGNLLGFVKQIVYRSERTGEVIDWEHSFKSNEVKLIWLEESEVLLIHGSGLKVLAEGVKTGIVG